MRQPRAVELERLRELQRAVEAWRKAPGDRVDAMIQLAFAAQAYCACMPALSDEGEV